MFQIVLIDDSAKDTQQIAQLLSSHPAHFSHELHSFSSLAAGFKHLNHASTDLLLLDLEFTYQNITDLPYLDHIPKSIPVIIVSHLSHFQLSLAHRENIRGFVHKSKLQADLLPTILRVLDTVSTPRPIAHTVKFPPLNPAKDFGIEININRIRYIEFFTRNTYHVYLTDGRKNEIKSVPLKEFMLLLQEQGIENLCQISRNQLINLHYISSIVKIDHSRIAVRLVNLPTEFIVGKQYEGGLLTLLAAK